MGSSISGARTRYSNSNNGSREIDRKAIGGVLHALGAGLEACGPGSRDQVSEAIIQTELHDMQVEIDAPQRVACVRGIGIGNEIRAPETIVHRS
jgi:hypothetical protein